MSFDNYIAGIGPGGITDVYEAKVLICYLLSETKEPLTKEQINEVFEDNRFIDYFTYIQAIKELLASKHLVETEDKDKNNMYAVTQKGRNTANQLENRLPCSLREKVVKYALSMQKETRMKKYKDITVEKTSDGYIIKLIIRDIGSDILRLELFAPDKELAKVIRNEFLNNATNIYKSIFALSTKNARWFKEIGKEIKQ